MIQIQLNKSAKCKELLRYIGKVAMVPVKKILFLLYNALGNEYDDMIKNCFITCLRSNI